MAHEHAAFGHHRQIEDLRHAGVHLHLGRPIACRIKNLDALHRVPKPVMQALRCGCLLTLPGALQGGHQCTIGHHRAQFRHTQVRCPDVDFRLRASQGHGGRFLAHLHMQDGLGGLCGKCAQLLQQLNAAQ
jgi:hypothetical protein